MHKELTHKQAKEIILQAMHTKGTFTKGQSGEYDYVRYRTFLNDTPYEVQHHTNDATFIYVVENHGKEESFEHVYGGALLSSILGKDENPDKNTIYFAQ